ncbi:MAG: hypothetical protein ABFR63_06570 [Thermodesulfobacteriota bacterium]
MKKILYGLGLTLFLLSACNNSPWPFSYQYTSQDQVVVEYLGEKYTLDRHRKNLDTPFEYAFEADGDLNILLERRKYEIDSPYDVDSGKKKKSRKSKKRTPKKTKQ